MTSPLPVSGCTAWAGVEDLPGPVANLHDPQTWCGYLALSTDILWSATMRRWRGDTLTEDAVLRAAPGNGRWLYDRSWGHCGCYAGLTVAGLPQWGVRRTHVGPYRVRLPRLDVVDVTAVEVAGRPFAGWEADGSWLVRTDGRPWRVCGDATTVTYRFGRPPPAAGRVACVELAVEFGRAGSSNPDKACALPQRLQSVTRQGISFAALDDMDFLSQGLTGLYIVDAWIRSVNPHGRAQAATVWSPDLAVARRKVGTP